MQRDHRTGRRTAAFCLLAAAVLSVGATQLRGAEPSKKRPPNFVIVYADDMY
jgi:hypothetical protein